ncbi:MAG: NAD(P)-dependent oxidoreductase, partial [Huintestinicola sp.]
AVMLKNAVPSAEGALAAGINATPLQMLGQNVLVLGFGRIASLLAGYLVALRCNVTVAARSREKRVQAKTMGCRAVGFESLCNILPSVTLIYNTVPCAVLHDREIDAMSDECVYIELASASGINKDSMAKIRTRVINAQGLPSKTAPKTAGEILADSVLDILNNYDEGGGSNDNRT